MRRWRSAVPSTHSVEMDYPSLLNRIRDEVTPLCRQGKQATYIPELAGVPIDKFGMAVYTLGGEIYTAGDADEKFSIQSISKLFAFTLAFQLIEDDIWNRVGREPSGTPFNSLVQLEYERGIPRNPFINSGALVVTDVLCSRFVHAETALVQFLHRLSGSASVDYDLRVAQSEMDTGSRNRAMAHFMRSFGNLNMPVDDVVDVYCRHCAIEMTCVELAKAVSFLANKGRIPWSGDVVLDPSSTKRLNALMATCGTYDAAGDFLYRVGLPAKSGVGGGIVALIPGEMGLCVWSPGLDPNGNSLAGVKALELFTTYTGRSIF